MCRNVPSRSFRAFQTTVKLSDLLHYFSRQVAKEKEQALGQALDSPIETTYARSLGTIGTLHLYKFGLPVDSPLPEDVPLTILPPGDLEPTEGSLLQHQAQTVTVQLFEGLGHTTTGHTLIPDTSGFLETVSRRLEDMAINPEYYTLGPAERLVPWLDPHQDADYAQSRLTASPSVLTTIWNEDRETRWSKVGSLIVELLRQNKRLLLISPNHQSIDELTGFLAKILKSAALPFKSLLSCYEVPVIQEVSGFSLQEFSFEYQMHGFFAKSRANKDSLRKQYERFRELTPILAYKGQKQRDLNEVKLLEWRLLAQLSEFQAKIKDIDKTVAEYEAIPIWKRLAMQAAGKNVQTLGEYRQIYEQKIQELMREVEIAQGRIRELVPEAAIPKDMRPEYEALKEEITRLGGTQKIRELLAAGEGTNRQAFIQNKRLVITTPNRVVSDPLFRKVRFDILIVDDAPRIAAPFLLGTAGGIRERIILSGDTQSLSNDQNGGTSDIQWPQQFLSIPLTPQSQ